MHEQQVRSGFDSQTGRHEAGVHRGGDAPDGALILDLQAVGGALVILHVGCAEGLIAIPDDGCEGGVRHGTIKAESFRAGKLQ